MNTYLLTFIFALSIFIDSLQYLVIFDVILSWLRLAGINWRPKFLSDIIDPVYAAIRKIIPTSFGPVDFTPIIVILILAFANMFLLGYFPEVNGIINNLR